MGSLCDFCGDQRSMVYCRSDAASLCLSCDRNVHSANALSRRHSRTLLCDRCYSQPAAVRCIQESISLCHSCDWNGHGASASGSAHKRQTISCYSDCPSATELSRIWSFVLEFPPVIDNNCEQGMGLMSINEDSASTYWGPPPNRSSTDTVDISQMNDLNTPCDAGMKDIGIGKGDFYNDFPVDDVDLTFENYEELFGASHTHSEQHFDDVGIDSFFEMKENSAAKSNCQGELVVKASSLGQLKSMQAAGSNAVSVDSVMSAKTDPSMSMPVRQARSSLSLSISGLTGESSAGDYQDCGMSSMLFIGEPPLYPPGLECSIQAANRDSAVMRYKEKKKTRKFEKKIRYASRKARADTRRRVKGRFVKAGEAYDYDPLCQMRSF